LLDLPPLLCFSENYDSTISHFNLLRTAVELSWRKIRHLNFCDVISISPSAALVLASEIDQWNNKVKGGLRSNDSKWDPNIRRLLCEMGFFDLLRLPKPSEPGAKGDVTFLQFRRGTANSTSAGGELAKQLRVDIESIVKEKIRRHFLFEGLSEAITNVGQHAYEATTPPDDRHWWLSASYSSTDHMLSVTFFDHGLGIPTTLPKSTLREFLRGIMFSDDWSDGEKIKAAMEIGRSSTGKKERGQGLQNLVYFAHAHKFGVLSIYSGYGFYCQTFAGPRAAPQVRIENLRYPVKGTLIEWKVKLG
jgi:hypothetical protein